MKKHKFPTGLFDVSYASKIEGVSDAPADPEAKNYSMVILSGDDYKAFHSALHEGLHAFGIPSLYLHDKEGYSKTNSLAKFLWKRIKEMNL